MLPASKPSRTSITSSPAHRSSNKKHPPHLVKRGKYFYFRLAIPTDLRDAFPCREVKRSLKTGSLSAARILASAYEMETQALFATLRAKRINLSFQNLPTTPLRQKPEATKAPSTQLSEIMEEYIREKKPSWSSRTELEFTSSLDLLLKIIGDKRVLEISRSDCISCRDQLKEGKGRPGKGVPKPRAPKTVNQYMVLLSGIFKWTVKQGLIDRNPAEQLTLPLSVNALDQRKPYSTEDLKRVFSNLPVNNCEQRREK